MKVARLSETEVWLALIKLVMRVKVDCVRIHVVGLLVMMLLLLLHVKLSLGRKLTIALPHRRTVMLMTVVALALAVNLISIANTIEVEVWEATADLSHNSPPTSSVSDPTVAMSVWSTRMSGSEMRPHRLNQTDSLGMSSDRERPLNDIIPEWIHHQLTDALRITELVHVMVFDTVRAPFKTFLHDIRAKLLNSQEVDLPNNALANRMDIFIRANVKNVLDNVIPVSILHQLQRFIDDATDKMRPCRARRRI